MIEWTGIGTGRSSSPSSASTANVDFSSVGFGLLVLVALAAPIPLSALGVDSLVVGGPETPWSVFAFEGTLDGGFSSTVGPVGMLALSALVGVLVALLPVPTRPGVDADDR